MVDELTCWAIIPKKNILICRKKGKKKEEKKVTFKKKKKLERLKKTNVHRIII